MESSSTRSFSVRWIDGWMNGWVDGWMKRPGARGLGFPRHRFHPRVIGTPMRCSQARHPRQPTHKAGRRKPMSTDAQADAGHPSKTSLSPKPWHMSSLMASWVAGHVRRCVHVDLVANCPAASGTRLERVWNGVWNGYASGLHFRTLASSM